MSFFGSVQKGSASKFASKNKVPPDFSPDLNGAQIAHPPAPLQYQGLQVGPDFAVEYEPNETPAIDGSHVLSRTLSPFMIQVEPPMAYTSQGDKSKTNFAGILEAGHGSAPSAFRAARNALLGAVAGDEVAGRGRTVEEFVSGGYKSSPSGSDGIETRDLKGEGPSRVGTPAIADLYTAVDITTQLAALVRTPPLVLLINPTNLSMKYAKNQQYTERTRYGYVFQAWGESQPRLSIEAKCGAFISGGRGVQWASRRDSAAWQNLATAFHFYRHNGYIYDTVGKSNAHHFVGALSIHYDGWVYYGNMESFNYSFDEGQQHGGVVFSMEFVVNAMVDTSKASTVVLPMRSPIPSPSDPRYGGFEHQATNNGDGNIQVSVTDAVQTVAAGAVASSFVGASAVVAGTPVAVRGVAGFVPVAAVAAPIVTPQARITPFRGR